MSRPPLRVINVLSHGPAYELLSPTHRLAYAWSDEPGRELGVVNREWPGELGRWVLRGTDALEWEVWQPDARADRLLEHRFDDGVMHRLFPATEHEYRPGIFRHVRGLASGAM